tara:strand:- start:119 stop:844 length:726 start_codon:yes stop_codon:yes gene_type:complete
MQKIFHFFLSIIEFGYKKNLTNTLKKNLPKKINTFFDIGAHHGETTDEISKNFQINNAFLFEPSKKNFEILKKKLNLNKKIKKINLFNFALGDSDKYSTINEAFESSSSTINEIDTSTKYFQRKKNILKIFDQNAKISKSEIEIKSSADFINNNNIQKIDFMKIDTEGYEYVILKNLENNLKNIGLILFEHHYDLMIIKNYKFNNINNLLLKNNFKKIYKSKMKFRKSFEYIYLNREFKFD